MTVARRLSSDQMIQITNEIRSLFNKLQRKYSRYIATWPSQDPDCQKLKAIASKAWGKAFVKDFGQHDATADQAWNLVYLAYKNCSFYDLARKTGLHWEDIFRLFAKHKEWFSPVFHYYALPLKKGLPKLYSLSSPRPICDYCKAVEDTKSGFNRSKRDYGYWIVENSFRWPEIKRGDIFFIDNRKFVKDNVHFMQALKDAHYV